MASNNLVADLEALELSMRSLRQDLKQLNIVLVSKLETRMKAREIASKWFQDINNCFPKQINENVIKKYDEYFHKLLSLSAGNGRKTTYLSTLNKIIAAWKTEIYIPCIKSPVYSVDKLAKILEKVTDEEREYLLEAIGCAKNQFYRASVVLAWSAAINRVHRVVLKKGLGEFNKKSLQLKAIKTGRYKRYNKAYDIQDQNDLEVSVFDKDLLWIIEFWGLIDSNQHDRLALCYTMRNNSAHPGDAGISEDNLLSFYSDLKNMIFDNKNMQTTNI